MYFNQLNIETKYIDYLAKDNIVTPTAIQELVIPKIFSNSDILAISQTGTGKTLAYALPVVQLIEQNSSKRALILAPTRELALQISEVIGSLCELAKIRSTVVYGGVEYQPQIDSLAKKPEIIVATPGRLIDLIGQPVAEIDEIDFFIVDEVDQMLDLGFIEPIEQLSALRSEKSLTLAFSATISDKIRDVADKIAPQIEVVAIENQKMAVENIEQRGFFVEMAMMDSLLVHLLRSEKPKQSIVFCRSKKMADRVAKLLVENRFTAEAIHSDRSQAAREYILERFRIQKTSILVATDVIARGIDIDTITHIVNYGLPQDPEQYIHRIGRTGRAGRNGVALTMTTPEDKTLLETTCKLMKQHIKMDMSHPYMTIGVTKALDPKLDRKKKRR